MALFDGKIPPLEELLTEPPVRRLLQLLVEDIVCLIPGQVHQVLRAVQPSERGHYFHELVRDVLHRVEKGGYIRSTPVKRVPPPIVSEAPIFRLVRSETPQSKDLYAALERDPVPHNPETLGAFTFGHEPVYYVNDAKSLFEQPSLGEISCYAGLAKRRVPRLETHLDKRLYFATNKAAELFQGDKRPASLGEFQSRADDLDIELRAARLIDWHRAVEDDDGASGHEIAGSQFTAVLNINQFMLANRFRSKFAAKEWRYRALGRIVPNNHDGELYVKGQGSVALYFLRPMPPDELESAIHSWWSQSLRYSECWWI